MPGRRLSPDETALWARVADTVTPLAGQRRKIVEPDPRTPVARAQIVAARAAPPCPSAKPSPPGETLDGGWDRRLRRGMVAPDFTIDLHGHTLASAHALLDRALGQALAAGDRLLLLVTGKPPRGDAARRGAIRASIGDWLAMSPHAGRIAAVRAAHPRHGGAGALYVVLRRAREAPRG